MTYDDFISSIKTDDAPPADISPALQALWWDAAGDWEKSHNICQGEQGRQLAWIHGYLHRKEGDLSNAGYWYGRAGKARHEGSLEEEWERIAKSIFRDLGE